MSRSGDPERDKAKLRAAAEAKLSEESKTGAGPPPAEELLHELRVYQIELEMQNETLRQTQLALAESRDRYVDLYEFAPVGYLTLHSDGRVAQINLTGASLLGEDRGKLVDRPLTPLVAPEDRQHWSRFLQELKRTDAGRNIELAFRRSDGTTLHAQVGGARTESTAADLAAAPGATSRPAIRLALTDISELRKLEAARHESDARYRAIVQSVQEAMVTIDSEGSVVDWNPGAERLFGYAPDEVLGQPVTWIMPERYRADHKASVARMVAGGPQRLTGKPVEFEGRRKDGSEFALELSLAAWRTAGSWFCTAVLRDLSDRNRARDARVALEAKLRESQKMQALGTLAGGVAHDFNNVLAAILGNVELATDDIGPGHRALECLEEIRKASERARRLVDQILLFGRRRIVAYAITPLTVAVEESARLLRATLPASVRFDVVCTPDAPTVRADSMHIEQMILNLCDNASAATKRSGRPPAIEIRLESWQQPEPEDGNGTPPATRTALKPGRYACLSVRDNGIGMDETTQKRIFEPFFTTKDVGEGTGLGLAVVYGIAQDHKAILEVRSQPGEGTEFRVYFPAAESNDAAASGARSAPDAAPEAVPAPSSGKGVRVLFIDDNEAIVLLMERLLKRAGHTVSGFSDPHRALEAARAHPDRFDIAVTDFNMPQLSGLELARELHLLRADLPIILISGFVTDELRASAPAAGVNEIVYKAAPAADLCAAIERHTRDRKR